MTSDRSPAVRAAAAEAIGQAGGLATIPWATALLKDLDPRVVAAAARAVGALGARLQRPSVVKQWVTSLKDDKRPGVAQAAADALAGNA
jgi:HEAT repeat protein